MNTTLPTFAKQDSLKFFRTLNSRVNNYFKENNISKTGNWKLHLKTIILFTLFTAPYIIIVSTPQIHFGLFILLSLIIGVGMAGIGMNVMHDGNHGSYSNKPWINNIMGGSIYILAGNVYNWQVQHNVLHHTYTNIPGHDEDLDAGRVIRFTKEAKWERFHAFQHYYSLFLYGLLTFNWCFTTDFKQMNGYLKRDLSYGDGTIRYDLHKRANASLHSGLDLKHVVKLPPGEEINDWIAVHGVAALDNDYFILTTLL